MRAYPEEDWPEVGPNVLHNMRKVEKKREATCESGACVSEFTLADLKHSLRYRNPYISTESEPKIGGKRMGTMRST